MKTNRGTLFKKMLAVMTVAAIMAAVGLLGLLPAFAQEATRSFNPATVEPGGQVTVTIAVASYGGFGSVTETLPTGFSYVSSNLDDAQVDEVDARTVEFILQGETSFTYTVDAPSTEASYTFSGTLRDSSRDDHAIGDSSVTVGSPDEATDASLLDVTVKADPASPGAAAEYTIEFVTGEMLEADTAQIILDIDSSIGVPTSFGSQRGADSRQHD